MKLSVSALQILPSMQVSFFFFLVDVGVWSLFSGAGFASRSTLSHLIALVALVFPVYFRAAVVG